MGKEQKRCLWVSFCLLLVMSCLSACTKVPQAENMVSESGQQHTEEPRASSSAKSETISEEEDSGRHNIVSDGEELYTIHRQTDGADLIQGFQTVESGLKTLWQKTREAGAGIRMESGELQIFQPAPKTEAENAAREGKRMAEYPFGRDLNLTMEAESFQRDMVQIKLQMIHPSTGERLQKLSFFVNNSDWMARIAENIIVDHQHCYIGFGCRNKKGRHMYRFYHYAEVDGFRKLMEYNWGRSEASWESCAWIRGNDVYVFSPDGRKNILYNVVEDEIIDSGS